MYGLPRASNTWVCVEFHLYRILAPAYDLTAQLKAKALANHRDYIGPTSSVNLTLHLETQLNHLSYSVVRAR